MIASYAPIFFRKFGKPRYLTPYIPGVGNRGVGGYTPPGRKNFENTTPLRIWKKYTPHPCGAKRRRHFFGQIWEINVNST